MCTWRTISLAIECALDAQYSPSEARRMETQMTLKAGTRIEVQGWDLSFNETWEPAKIARPRKDEGSPPGYHIVAFADGGRLNVHESRFRVTDNRA